MFRKSDSGVHALDFYIILPLAYTSISFLYTSNAKFANKTEKGSHLFIIEAKKKVLQINLVRCIETLEETFRTLLREIKDVQMPHYNGCVVKVSNFAE